MPRQRCVLKGQPGFKWGKHGKCYIYKKGNRKSRQQAKKKAFLQGLAMGEK